MKKTFFVALISSFIFTAGTLDAADKDGKTMTYEESNNLNEDIGLQNKGITEAEKVKIKEEGVNKKEEELKKAKELLSRQEWTIYLMSLSDKQAKIKNDTLTFAEGKAASKELSGKGYPQTNYTLTLQDDGAIVWETMQSNEKEDVVFWRGELKDGVMRGIVSIHPKDGKNNQDYSFSTEAPVIPEEKIGSGKVEEPQPVKVESPRKKKEKGKK